MQRPSPPAPFAASPPSGGDPRNAPLLLAALFLFAAIALPAQAAPDPLVLLAGERQAAALRAGERPSEVQMKAAAFRLLPNHGGLRAIAGGLQAAVPSGVCAEVLTLYKKPAPHAWTAAEQAALFNAALSLSSLAGIQYYSASRQAMRTFYETSVVVDGPAGKNEMPDPRFRPPLPAKTSLYARQKDLTFGENLYRYDYYAQEGALIFVQENLSPLSYGIIPAIGKGKLRSLFAVLDAGDSLLIYTVSLAKAAALPGLSDRVGASFSNRTTAFINWYMSRADGVLGP
ncbi:MAG: hypothetical protein LBR16_06530 [Treponema sp.]|jgi:hypothetical protein|nr:hypothetical protein [Treponema sp.]